MVREEYPEPKSSRETKYPWLLSDFRIDDKWVGTRPPSIRIP
jgi:hypothetical protein